MIGKKYVFAYAKHMGDALPGASFIGLTPSPAGSVELRPALRAVYFGCPLAALGCVSLFDEIIELRPEWAGSKLPNGSGGTMKKARSGS